jgi:hypothetical protein
MQTWMWIVIGLTSGSVVLGVLVVLAAIIASHNRSAQ